MESVPISTRWSDIQLAKIDQARVSWTRSEYIRKAVGYALAQGFRGKLDPAEAQRLEGEMRRLGLQAERPEETMSEGT